MVWGRFSKPVISLAIEIPTTKKDMMRYRFLKIPIKILFFHFYFLNQDFLFTNRISTSRLCNLINNVYLEGTVSQIFDLGPSFYFMSKNG